MDNNLMNEDWLKTRSWDIRNLDGSVVTTLPQLLDVLDLSHETPAKQKAGVKHFTETPAYTPAPDRLKREVTYLLSH